ncbi:GtrA family protein [Arvimicrobium flavum]|uniref:GtrA family protein n=1 Tax=Arvimicrobium flavum TaxID=3393320 RepID=UPI00237BF9FC|nr:GtrA family protein [Mesorhizobium shangrilense]
MTAVTAESAARRPLHLSTGLGDLGLALGISIFIFATYAAAGFPTLSSPGGDNDSLLRLVEVRDLLGGQAWFDLHQYRMGPEGGFVMHWSRLIDAPLAGIALLASALGAGVELSEGIALTLWPLLLMAGTLFGLIQIARSLGGDHTVLPTATLGAGALYFVGIYRPGSIDHHNAQIALTVAMLAFLVKSPGKRRFPALAGVAAAVMLAIGMETAPYVAVGGAAAALAFLFGDEREARGAASFGLSFAAATFAAFLITVGPANWSVPECDAMSNVQLALAAFGGIGLALVALSPATNSTFGRRLLGLFALSATFLAVARFAFPQCLGDPYAAIDPRLRSLWLDYVAEAQSVIDLARADWTKLLAYFVTPAIALGFLAIHLGRHGVTRAKLIYGGFLLATFLVSCWQVRGSSFSIPLATGALALGLGGLRERIAVSPSPARSVALVAVWLASFNLLWSAAGGALSARAAVVGMASSADECSADAGFTELASLPAGAVLAVSDLGAPILANTPHRVLAGPYHRNVAGNLAMIDAFLAKTDDAEAVVRSQGIDHVALCRGNAENRNFTQRSPDGLMADLMAERVPSWLALDPETRGHTIEIYRVLSPASR